MFACEFNEGLVHQVVTAYLAAGRAGTKAQKTRRDVSGGGIKPWRQKGTGRARAGSIRSPLWRKGGVTFAARPRNFEQKVNKKVYRLAMRMIFAELARTNRLVIEDSFSVESPKTKLLVGKLSQMNLANVLIITLNEDLQLQLAARNIPGVQVTDSAHINPVDLIGYESVLITKEAARAIEENLS